MNGHCSGNCFKAFKVCLFTATGFGLWDIKETYRRGYFTKRFKKLKEKYNKYLKAKGESLQLGGILFILLGILL